MLREVIEQPLLSVYARVLLTCRCESAIPPCIHIGPACMSPMIACCRLTLPQAHRICLLRRPMTSAAQMRGRYRYRVQRAEAIGGLT